MWYPSRPILPLLLDNEDVRGVVIKMPTIIVTSSPPLLLSSHDDDFDHDDDEEEDATSTEHLLLWDGGATIKTCALRL